jgi:N,N'-diacetylbacillosaminyl-diphospho-undecaprenol alpha-1,3-N-acetylgalactosaminyltransferase
MCLDLYRIFRTEKPDIVHNMTIKPNVYGSLAARLAGVPKIVSLVNGAGTGFAEGGGWKRAVLRFLVRRLYQISGRASSCMYFQNPDDLELFVRLGIVTPEKALLIRSGGINVEEFSSENVDQDTLEDLRAELGVGPETQVVLMVVGRAIWSKGVREFVEVSQCARQWRLPAKFVLVGPIEPHNPDAVPEEYLRNVPSPHFVHLGFRDEIRELLALANVVVLPSYYREGVPRVLLEALAMSKPVVTTDSVGCREVVEHGKNGFLVPIRDSQALGSAIRTLLEDRDRQAAFGAHSLVKAREEFDERTIVQKILTDVYGFPAAGLADGCSTDKHLVTT